MAWINLVNLFMIDNKIKSIKQNNYSIHKTGILYLKNDYKYYIIYV